MSELPPLSLIGGALFIDNSSWMEGLMTCDRYTEYKNLWRRIHAGEKAALNFGSATHIGTEFRYARYANRPVDEQYYNDVGLIYADFFEQHPTPDLDWRNLNWAMTLLRRYNEHYATEEFGLLKYNEPIDCPYCQGGVVTITKPAKEGSIAADEGYSHIDYEKRCLWCSGTGKREIMVELPFTLPLYVHKSSLGEIPVNYTGKIDLPVGLEKRIWTFDTKTTSMLGDMFWNEQRVTAQHRGYVWALKKLYPDVDVAGYIVNAIRTKEPPQYVMQGKEWKGRKQSPEEWWRETFQRERKYVSAKAIQEWEFNTIELVESFFWHYSRGYMPMKTKWCSQYGKCTYYDVCIMDAEDRGAMIRSGAYTDNTWSPLKQPTDSKQ